MPTSGSSANSLKYVIRAAIPLQAAGTVIGRGGASIKELQDRSYCKIQLAETQGDAHNTRERLAIFSGPTSAIVARVIELLLSCPLFSSLSHSLSLRPSLFTRIV